MRPAVWAPQATQVRAVIGAGHDRIIELVADPARPGWWQLEQDLAPATPGRTPGGPAAGCPAP